MPAPPRGAYPLGPRLRRPGSNPTMRLPGPTPMSTLTAPPNRYRPWMRALIEPLPARVAVARQLDLDAVRGIAILLVVIGHVVARDMPAGNGWYETLHALIYRFHMPLFMTVTGISFALSLPAFPSAGAVIEYSRRRCGRLLVPYLFFGLLILAGKLAAAGVVHVDNRPEGSLQDLLALIVNPLGSASSFLWFIYVLGLYFLVVPALLQASTRRPLVIFLASLAALAIDWPQSFLLAHAFAYLPFFSAGMLLWMCREHWAHMGAPTATAWLAVFGIALALALPLGLPSWWVGALSVPALLGLAQVLPASWQQGLAWVGQHSLSIYLMNTLAIGVSKAALLKLMPWDGINFLVFFPLLAIAGAAMPIAVKQMARRHAPAVDRFL